MSYPGSLSSAGSASRFANTRWSVVLAAGNWRAQGAGTEARRAMGELARVYWFPLYAYLRRKGNPPQRAEDLVQGFFARLLEKDALAGVDRAKGKFRAFLLASLNHYLANEWDKERAAKRGGGERVLSLDAMEAETRYAQEPADTMTPERVFERRWALAVLDQVLSRLREDYAARGQGEVFAALEHVLVGGEKEAYGSVAEKLGMNEGAAKVAGHRMRKRFRELLREEIAQTVAEEGQVEEEIRELLGKL